MKRCNSCKLEKDEGQFWKRSTAKDGLQPRCKECQAKATAAVYRSSVSTPDGLAKMRAKSRTDAKKARDAAFRKTEAGKAATAAAIKRYQARYPERYKANIALNHAVRDGIVARQPCLICGDEKSHGHHADYGQPLSVTWLCRKHHLETHALVRHEART